jgi:hypothetical protein
VRKIETEILINAPPDKVWRAFMDFQSWPKWNPFIISLVGEPRVGGRIKFTAKMPDGMTGSFRPEVLKAEENREFRWVGHLLVTGIFDGEHVFIFEPSGEKTLFKQSEYFSGFLPRFMPGMLKKTEAGFNLMNQALKIYVEEKRG